jgi:hypothetical protein
MTAGADFPDEADGPVREITSCPGLAPSTCVGVPPHNEFQRGARTHAEFYRRRDVSIHSFRKHLLRRRHLQA